MSRADLTALIARVEAARGPDREVDAEIERMVSIPYGAIDVKHYPNSWVGGHWFYRVFGLSGWEEETQTIQRYTGSLGAAVTLYPALPDMIPSCPRKATAAALRARLASMGDDA
jgi:hypothetical protein